MSRFAPTSRWAVLLALTLPIALSAAPGCGGPEAIPVEKAGSVPVFNPSKDNPLKDVTLDNESQYKDKIGGIPK